jgi:hypothetical protein
MQIHRPAFLLCWGVIITTRPAIQFHLDSCGCMINFYKYGPRLHAHLKQGPRRLLEIALAVGSFKPFGDGRADHAAPHAPAGNLFQQGSTPQSPAAIRLLCTQPVRVRVVCAPHWLCCTVLPLRCLCLCQRSPAVRPPTGGELRSQANEDFDGHEHGYRFHGPSWSQPTDRPAWSEQAGKRQRLPLCSN